MIPENASYTFRRIGRCAMCDADVVDARTLGRRLSCHQGLRPVGKTGLLTTVQRCRTCGLVFANPMPVPRDLQDHYDVSVDEYWAQRPMSWTASYFQPQIAHFRRLWGRPGRPTALDIGAGAGMAMISLEKAGFTTHGIEPSRSFRDAAISRNGVPADRLALAGVDDARFDAESFDFVTFGAVLEHLPSPASALTQAVEWTRPGGLIHAEVPSSDWLMARLLDGAYRAQGLDYTTHLSPLHIPYHLYEFTLDSFTAYARRSECDVAHHQRFVGRTFAPSLLRPLLSAVMKATHTGMQLEVWLRKDTA